MRRPLGALFSVLALAMTGIAVAAAGAHRWVIVFAAAALAAWLGGLALSAMRSN